MLRSSSPYSSTRSAAVSYTGTGWQLQRAHRRGQQDHPAQFPETAAVISATSAGTGLPEAVMAGRPTTRSAAVRE